MKPHIEKAKLYWKELLTETDTVIDATCGNGWDTLELAKQVPRGKVISYDIQPEAIENAKKLTKGFENIEFRQQCHTEFEGENIKLIVYNLGYLPGGNKEITTLVETTLKSIKWAQEILAPGGMISITCYPGHPEGGREEERLLEYVGELSSQKWLCCYHKWLNRKKAPTLLIIQELIS